MLSKKHPLIFTFNVLIFYTIILWRYTNLSHLKIFGVTPLLILPLLTAFSLFHSPISSALTGLFTGIFMDAVASGSYCFNAIILLCIGTFVSLASNNLFNKNIPASIVLSLITSAIYFIFQWIFFHARFENMKDSLIFLLNYALPSVFVSAVFIIPFYFLYNYFNKITNQ